MNLAAFDLNLLRVFDAMMLELSTVRAGERVGLSQPAVSSALGRLRAILGDELFVRDGNRMMPTPRALQLKEPVRQALVQIEEALAASAAFDPRTSTRSFMLIGSDYFSTLLMPKLAARVTPTAPSIVLQMMDYPSADVFGLLSDGKADIVLDRALETPEWIASQRLFRSWLVCIARRGHPLISASEIRPGAALPADVFCAIPQVLRSADGSRSGTIDPALQKLGLSRKVAITVPHFQAVALAVANSDLLGSIPVHFARLVAEHLELDIFMPPMESPAMDVTMYWHRRLDRDAGNAWLREQLVAVASFEP
ncbi:LysR family transcriptional regulator [Mesorhizobium sp. WSM4884]|uniref:LysR family transcriptional regulator n=1 Tax=Mesorhizobium sp. WSM4884 TaxID=3038542 RepID=UPI002415E5C9|nr:LysR family transcriptional regulator [Mesorhizobium sp. WSM4884]MDG4885536.1 LysR family transcriptional regulator [Mesorhizobium sp. WSM4884]